MLFFDEKGKPLYSGKITNKKRAQKSNLTRSQFPIERDPKPLYDKNVKLKKRLYFVPNDLM